MKILVFSDTHGYVASMSKVIEREEPEYVIHLGDHTRDTTVLRQQYPMLPLVSVRGNCDYDDRNTPELRIVNYEGISVLCTHGHTYNVKSGLLRLYMAAKEKAVHIALFGHTHCAYCEQKDGLWMLNPGSCGKYNTPTYGVITVDNGQPNCSIRHANERTDVV